MNNGWNRVVYRLWVPFYDWLIESPLYVRGRKAAWNCAHVKQGEDVLLVGVGTGVDMKYLPDGASITAIDISDAMLNAARKKAVQLHLSVLFLQAEAEKIPRLENSYDLVALHLILSVVADPAKCFQEAVRLAKPGGRIIVFDKFLEQGKSPSLLRKALNFITRPFGTDVNRQFEEMMTGTSVTVLHDEPISTGSAFRVILLRCQ